MNTAVYGVFFVCLSSALLVCVGSQPVDSSSTNEIQNLGRRYAESTIASDISKIMDSMVQKNFVNFLLNQREKKSEAAMVDDPDYHIFNDLLKKEIMVRVYNKGDGFK
ncbi:gastric inhibitory polypeptide [Paramisgurnus dabryanus]|uniref:gastric inhibitory polypeptide n=1 Tax=Paramisgurnus dabryanus TaxID=90735 RepID=UPI003CCF0DCF